MAELVDALDLGPSNLVCESSSLSIRNLKMKYYVYSFKFYKHDSPFYFTAAPHPKSCRI